MAGTSNRGTACLEKVVTIAVIAISFVSFASLLPHHVGKPIKKVSTALVGGETSGTGVGPIGPIGSEIPCTLQTNCSVSIIEIE